MEFKMLHQLVNENLKLLESGNFADVEIICKDRVFKAHKAILGSRSPFFQAAFSGNWEESASGKIRVDQMDPDTIELMLKYIYTSEFSILLDEAHENSQGHLSLVICIQLYIHGDYFQLKQLKDDAFTHIKEMLHGVLLNLWTFTGPVESSSEKKDPKPWKSSPLLDSKEINFVSELTEAIKAAYGHPATRKLQKFLLVASMGLRDRMPKKTFCSLMEQVPSFNVDAAALLLDLQFRVDDNGLGVGKQLCDRARQPEYPGPKYIHCSDCKSKFPNKNTAKTLCIEVIIMVDPFVGSEALWCYMCRMDALTRRMDSLMEKLL